MRPGPRRQFRETVEVVASGGGRRHFQVLASQLGSGTSFQSLVLAANARGDAVAAWLEVTTNGGMGRVFAAFSRRGRQFSRPVRVSRGLGLNPSVAINGAGEALIAWRAQRVVLARDGRSRARLGRVIHIADAPGFAGTTAAAIGPDGRAVVAWYAGAAKPCGGNGETSYSLRVAARRSFSAPVELSHCLNTNAYRSTPVEAAFDSRGKAVIAWEAAGAAVATPKVVQIGPSGEGGAPTALGPAGADLKDLAVAGTAAAVSIVLDEGTLGGPPFTGRRHLLVSQLARGEFSSPHEVDVGGQVPGDAAAIAVNPVTRSALSVFEAGPRYPGPTGVDWAEGPAPTR